MLCLVWLPPVPTYAIVVGDGAVDVERKPSDAPTAVPRQTG